MYLKAKTVIEFLKSEVMVHFPKNVNNDNINYHNLSIRMGKPDVKASFSAKALMGSKTK